jgi:hypothetical protein
MIQPLPADPVVAKKATRRRKKGRVKAPAPIAIGTLVNYVGVSGKTLVKGAALRVVAEACNKRFIVEAMTLDGKVVRRTVAANSIVERMPDLFAGLDENTPVPSSLRRLR